MALVCRPKPNFHMQVYKIVLVIDILIAKYIKFKFQSRFFKYTKHTKSINKSYTHPLIQLDLIENAIRKKGKNPTT